MHPTKFRFIAPMEGSVLNFLKAEWKVRVGGSAHWASSYTILTTNLYDKSQTKVPYGFVW
jgi:hypothetical protein